MHPQNADILRELHSEISRLAGELAAAHQRLTASENQVLDLNAENQLLIDTIKYIIFRRKDNANADEKDMQVLPQ